MKLPIFLLLLAYLQAGEPGAASPQGGHAGSLSADGSSQPETIVVVGTKPNRETIHQFVDGLTVNTEGQIARFEQPVCPASFGLPEAYNRVIERRLRDDAERVGLRTAGEACDPNIVVIIADDPRPLVSALQRKRPQMFVGLEFSQVQDILKTKAPVRTWQAIEPRGTDGRPLQRVMFFGDRPISGSGAWLNPAAANSLIRRNTRPDLVASFVIIASDAVDGLTLTQVADYAAMRTLARTRFGPGLQGRSILGVIDGSDGDRGIDQLTPWDLAYLRALYRTSNTVSASMQQSSMTSAMDRYLKAARE